MAVDFQELSFTLKETKNDRMENIFAWKRLLKVFTQFLQTSLISANYHKKSHEATNLAQIQTVVLR